MDSDQAQPYAPRKPAKPPSRAKIGEQALPLQKSRLSSELEALRAVSKRTFACDDRMAVNTFLGAIFNQVTQWDAEDRLEEGLYRLLDALKAPVPLRIGEAFAVAIYCLAPHVDDKRRSKWARALRFAAAISQLMNQSSNSSSAKAGSMRVLPHMRRVEYCGNEEKFC